MRFVAIALGQPWRISEALTGDAGLPIILLIKRAKNLHLPVRAACHNFTSLRVLEYLNEILFALLDIFPVTLFLPPHGFLIDKYAIRYYNKDAVSYIGT